MVKDKESGSTPSVEGAGERRWYNYEQKYVTWEEFRSTPMGVDFLNDPDTEAAEKALEERWGQMETEAEHSKQKGHFDLQEMADTEKPWELMGTMEKVETAVVGFTKFVAIWCVLYLFIISLGIMGDAFKILGGRSSGRAFREAELLANPVAGLAIGILATVLMQSSSTTTSIVVSMAAAELVTVKNATYLVMGANIGTSVTNTIVSIAHLNSPAEYRRAFTGAVFHDMFNWLTVGVFLPLEASSAFLVELAAVAVDSLGISNDDKQDKVEFIKKITKPAGGRVVSTDKKLIEKIAQAETEAKVKELEKETIIKQSSGHVLRDTPMSDDEAGVLMLFVSLTMLATCLLLLVKLLQSVLKGKVAKWTRTLLNFEFTHPILRSCGGFDNYILLLFGVGCTILVQSSSVFTSTLTPLVGIGLIHIDKAVALTHGANIGTTVTGVLSALSGSNLEKGLQVALEHVFFNCLGSFLWFFIWPLRPVPLNMAKFMGETAANMRTFPLIYIVGCFLLMPLLIIGLSIPGWEVLLGVMGPIFLLFLVGVVWVLIRRNRADLLPRSMPILRAEAAPCGCQYPNFMQLWGGDAEKDQVDLDKLKRDAEEAEARAASVRAWPYSPAAWGLGLLGFTAVVLALPTSQWRRVRYAKEARGRKEIGLGLWEVCSEAYEKEHSFMAAPTYACTNAPGEAMARCAGELEFSCTSDSAWAAGSSATESVAKLEALVYERAFERCSKYGCRAAGWVDACTALPACADRPRHAQLCRDVVASYKWFETINPDRHGVELSWAAPTDGQAVDDTVAHDPGLFAAGVDDEEDETQTVKGFKAGRNYTGLVFDKCTGRVQTMAVGAVGTKTTKLVNATLQLETTTAGTNRTVHEIESPVEELPLRVADFDVLKTRTGAGGKLMIAADASEPRLVLFNETTNQVERTYTAVDSIPATSDDNVHAVLPAVFNKGTLGAVAVNAAENRAVVCLEAAAGVAEKAELAASRVVRCALLNVTDVAAPKLLAQKAVLLQDAGADQKHVRVVGASWLDGDKVLLAQRVSVAGNETSATADALEVDFETGSNLEETDFADSLNLEDMTVDTAATPVVPKFDATRELFKAGVLSATARRVLNLAVGGVRAHRVSGVAVLNKATVAVVEAGPLLDGDDGDQLQAHLVQVPHKDIELGEKKAKCAKTSVPKFAKGAKCRDISEICPEGDLAGDMETVGGLAVTGALFLGVSTLAAILYSVWMHHPVFGKLHYVAAGAVLLAWILLCAAWGHMDQLTQNRYGCYFEDEALRKGMVLHRGKLEHLMMASYSWGFCIYAWGMTTISGAFILTRVGTLLVWPHRVPEAVKETEPANEEA